MACWWRRSTSRLTGRCSTQGDVHRDRAAEQARAARRGPRGAGEGGAEGDCGVYRRVPFRRPAVLPAHRQGLRRIALQDRDRRGRAWSAFAVKVPSTDRHLYAIDAAPHVHPRGPGRARTPERSLTGRRNTGQDRPGSHQVPDDVRRGKFAVPPPPAAVAEGAGDPGHGQLRRGRRKGVVRLAASFPSPT